MVQAIAKNRRTRARQTHPHPRNLALPELVAVMLLFEGYYEADWSLARKAGFGLLVALVIVT